MRINQSSVEKIFTIPVIVFVVLLLWITIPSVCASNNPVYDNIFPAGTRIPDIPQYPSEFQAVFGLNIPPDNDGNSIKIPAYAQINADNSYIPWNVYSIVSSFAFPSYDKGNIIIPGNGFSDFNYTGLREQQEKKSYNRLMNPI